MILSVVIVSYNVKFFLEQCLSSLKKAIDGISPVEVRQKFLLLIMPLPMEAWIFSVLFFLLSTSFKIQKMLVMQRPIIRDWLFVVVNLSYF